MARAGSFMLVLLCLMALQAQCQPTGSSDSELCPDVTPQTNIDTQQVDGRWFLSEAHGQQLSYNTTSCNIIDIDVLNATNLNVHTPDAVIHLTIPDQTRPWYWTVQGSGTTTIAVVHLCPHALILSRCGTSNKAYVVLTKSLPSSSTQRQSIQQAVTDGGIGTGPYEANWICTATCS